MSWANKYIEELRAGRAVAFRPRGHSMTPRIRDGQLCTVEPVEASALAAGDIVLCVVGRAQYLHFIKAVQGDRYQIGNNHGRINGWVGANAVHGRLVRVEASSASLHAMDKSAPRKKPIPGTLGEVVRTVSRGFPNAATAVLTEALCDVLVKVADPICTAEERSEAAAFVSLLTGAEGHAALAYLICRAVECGGEPEAETTDAAAALLPIDPTLVSKLRVPPMTDWVREIETLAGIA